MQIFQKPFCSLKRQKDATPPNLEKYPDPSITIIFPFPIKLLVPVEHLGLIIFVSYNVFSNMDIMSIRIALFSLVVREKERFRYMT